MTSTRKWLVVLIVVVVAGVFFGFTKPGHRVLNTLGIATAECDDYGCR